MERLVVIDRDLSNLGSNCSDPLYWMENGMVKRKLSHICHHIHNKDACGLCQAIHIGGNEQGFREGKIKGFEEASKYRRSDPFSIDMSIWTLLGPICFFLFLISVAVDCYQYLHPRIIERPYQVTITRVVPDAVMQTSLMECQNEWRNQRREIRRLRHDR